MALTTTTLASPSTATGLTFNVTSATGATVGGIIRVDNEFAFITAINGTQIETRGRGFYGGTAVAHNTLAVVVFGLTTDLAQLGVGEALPVNQNKFDIVTIGANGAITPPTRDTVYIIMKGSALASSTLADPSASQDGLTVTFITGTDFAHVVTTVNCYDGTTGASTTLTSAAFKGSSITLMAMNAFWMVVSNELFVIT